MAATQTKQRVVFRNILFATDFSPAANNAKPYAAGLAKSFGAKLFALHVVEPTNYALPPELWLSAQAERDLEMQLLREAMTHDLSGLAPEVLEGEGAVGLAVKSAVEKHHIDLVVVGTRGRTGVGKAFLGSQAEEILRHATCPVLTVGPETQSEDRQRGKLASILCATNFGSASLAASRISVALAEEYQSKLTLLHVIEHRGADQFSTRADFAETSERRLREMVPEEAGFWCTPHFVVEHGSATDKILEVANRIQADLIVLGAHKPEGVPGASTHLPIATIHHIVAHAQCPVLTVRG